MIQPILPNNFHRNYTKQPAFKGAYDPAVQTIKDKVANTAKEHILPGFSKADIKEGINKFLHADIFPSGDRIVQENGVDILKHTLPDGMTSFDVALNGTTERIIETTTDQNVIRHILPDGATVVDIPVDAANDAVQSATSKLSYLEDLSGHHSELLDIIHGTSDTASTLAEEAGGSLLGKIAEHLGNIL